MLKKKFFRGVSVLLMIAMLTIFVACGQSSNQASETSPSVVNSTASEETVTIEPVQIDVLSLPANESGVYDQTWWGKVLKEKAGIILNVLPTGGAEGSQKLQALMAGGELPDIVVFQDIKDIQNAARGNMLTNLDDHKEKLPNVFKNVPTALQYYRDNVSNSDGKLYAIPNNVGISDQGTDPDYGPFLRWDLYKQAGMPVINTLEDYLPALKKMQELYPKTKDGKKVYSFSLFKDWDGYGMANATALSPLIGIDCGDDIGSLPFLQADYNSFETKNVLDPDSEYIRALRFYYEANQMGLVDPDSLTQNFDTAKSKANEGRILFSWWSWFCADYNTEKNINAETPSGFLAVPPNDSKAILASSYPVGTPWAFSISSATKKLDACLRYVDFMYSTDGLQELANGPKGVTWDIDSNGKPFLTEEGWKYVKNASAELPDGGKLSDGTGIINSVGLTGAFINPVTKEPINYNSWSTTKEKMLSNPSKLLQDWQSVYGHKTTVDYLKANNKFTLQPLAPTMVPTMPDDIDSTSTAIGDIVKNGSWLMVFAKDDAQYKKLYDDMVKKAKGLGIDQVYEWSSDSWKLAVDKANKYK